MMLATEVGFGWSVNRLAAMSNGIRYFTRPGWLPWPMAKWSHMFLVFRLQDNSVVLHEALGSRGWTTSQVNKLYSWRERKPAHREFAIRWLPIPSHTACLIHKESCSWLGRKSYAFKQIGAFAISNSLLGRWLGLSVRQDDTQVICSEGAAKLVGEHCPEWDLRDSPDQSWDSVSPQSAYAKYVSKARLKNGAYGC